MALVMRMRRGRELRRKTTQAVRHYLETGERLTR
jgi:hypothetical protein